MNKYSEQLKDKKDLNWIIKTVLIFSLGIGSSLLFYFSSSILKNDKVPINIDHSGLDSYAYVGEFIGGTVGVLFSLASVFLLFYTLKEQRENFDKERLETNYFEMIKFHRGNVDELKYSYYEDEVSKVTVEKRKLFRIIFSQFEEAWGELNHLFEATSINHIYKENYLNKIRINSNLINRGIDFKQYAQIDIIYLIVFFGVGKEGKQAIFAILENKYEKKFIKNVLNFAALKPTKNSEDWHKWVELNKLGQKNELFDAIVKKRDNLPVSLIFTVQLKYNYYNDGYDKYYGGHQFRLGHYFRQVYQAVRFIDEYKYFSYQEKYEHIKILRAQLSNYEQIIFLLNSISEIGRTWELEKKFNPESNIKINKQLITKYNLIKNIPNLWVTGEINLLMYYPNIAYEAINNEEGKKNRKELETQYS